MITGEYEYIDDLASRNQCAECDGRLECTWDGDEDTYALKCGKGHYPDAIVPLPTMGEAVKQGLLPDGPIVDQVKEGIARRQGRKPRDDPRQALKNYTGKDLATGQDLSLAAIAALFEYAWRVRLDPWLGHVVLYHGKPYPTLDGMLYHANKSGKPYSMISGPLVNDKRQDYQVEDGDHAWIADLELLKTDGHFTGLGIVTRDEMTAMSKRDNSKLSSPVVAAHPWLMAQKRAEWQALRRAFPLGGE